MKTVIKIFAILFIISSTILAYKLGESRGKKLGEPQLVYTNTNTEKIFVFQRITPSDCKCGEKCNCTQTGKCDCKEDCKCEKCKNKEVKEPEKTCVNKNCECDKCECKKDCCCDKQKRRFHRMTLQIGHNLPFNIYFDKDGKLCKKFWLEPDTDQ